jgi:hypothetical protein
MFSRVLVSDWRAWISPAVHPASKLAPHRRRPERVRARQCSQMVGDGNIVGKWNANQPKMAYLTRKGSRLESCKGATMEDANVWEVDRIAASELLSLLKQTSEEDWGPVTLVQVWFERAGTGPVLRGDVIWMLLRGPKDDGSMTIDRNLLGVVLSV